MATVLITGGTGFLGRKLLDALLERGHVGDSDGNAVEIDRVRIADLREPTQPLPKDDRIHCTWGDFTEPGVAQSLIDDDTTHIVHLAAAVSGECEQDFDLGMRVNLDGTRGLLEATRTLSNRPKFVFTSSVAVYGGAMPNVLNDATAAAPQNSYGAQKVACEYLISDMSRRGFIDGRTARLPTVIVRPGKANAAASSFASAVVREPLQGSEYVCPVALDTPIWVLSPRKVIQGLISTLDISDNDWGAARTLKLPGITVTVQQMLDSVARLAGQEVAERVSIEPDDFIQNIISGWPARFDLQRSPALGFTSDENIDAIVTAFIEDELNGTIA